MELFNKWPFRYRIRIQRFRFLRSSGNQQIKLNGFAVDVGKCVANISALTEVPIFKADPRPANVHYQNVEPSIEDRCCTSTTSSNQVSKKRKRS